MLQVFGRVKSRTFRVVWLLEELDIPYELKEVGPRSEDAKKVYKNGKIPFILDNENLITDSVAILTYLSDKHKVFTEASGTIKRAKQDAITFRILDELEALLWVAAKHAYVFPSEKKVPDILDILKWEFAINQEKIINEFPLDNFICGEKFLVPDILLTHCLTWAESMDFAICDDLTKYANKLRERSAYKKTYALR
jgi:glutathione S-transferase